MTTADDAGEGEQLALLAPRAAVRRGSRRLAGDDPPSERLPVALVQVDSGLAHLDRPFEYTVPSSMDATAEPGVRVKVRFAGQDLDGFVLELLTFDREGNDPERDRLARVEQLDWRVVTPARAGTGAAMARRAARRRSAVQIR